MSNHPDEERLALCFRDDLWGDECRTVKEHVRACGVCQGVVSEFHWGHELLETFSPEPTAEELLEVRHAVLSRLADHKKQWSASLAALGALAAAAAIVLFAMFPLQRAPVYVRPAVAVRHIVPKTTVPSLPRAVHTRRKVHPGAAPGLRSVDLIARGDDAPVIKMTTADPNVVILLQTERTANYD